MSDNYDAQKLAEACETGRKISLTRVRLNQGGYDSSGQYFGRGAPLYRAQSEMGDDAWVRAPDRKTAKERIVSRIERVSAPALASKIKGCFRK